jgi:hypothetical protein
VACDRVYDTLIKRRPQHVVFFPLLNCCNSKTQNATVTSNPNFGGAMIQQREPTTNQPEQNKITVAVLQWGVSQNTAFLAGIGWMTHG